MCTCTGTYSTAVQSVPLSLALHHILHHFLRRMLFVRQKDCGGWTTDCTLSYRKKEYVLMLAATRSWCWLPRGHGAGCHAVMCCCLLASFPGPAHPSSGLFCGRGLKWCHVVCAPCSVCNYICMRQRCVYIHAHAHVISNISNQQFIFPDSG